MPPTLLIFPSNLPYLPCILIYQQLLFKNYRRNLSINSSVWPFLLAIWWWHSLRLFFYLIPTISKLHWIYFTYNLSNLILFSSERGMAWVFRGTSQGKPMPSRAQIFWLILHKCGYNIFSELGLLLFTILYKLILCLTSQLFNIMCLP